MKELALIVEELSGRRRPRMVAPMWLARASLPFAAMGAWVSRGRPRFTSASLFALRHHKQILRDKAGRELGYAPRELHTSVADTLEWFRAAGLR